MRGSQLGVLLVVVAACGGGAAQAPPPPVAPRPAPPRLPEILGYVPADTPYVFAAIDNRNTEGLVLGRTAKRRFVRALEQADPRGTSTDPGLRAIRSVLSELHSAEPQRWASDLGLAPDARYVLYGVGLYPVMRAEIADPVRVREVVAHAITATGAELREGQLGAQPYWLYARNGVAMLIAVREHDLVAALLPAAVAPTLVAQILGAPLAHSLRDAPTLPDAMRRYHLLGSGIGYVDFRALAQQIEALRPDEPPVCKAELERLVATVPRLVTGFARRDRAAFVGVFALELAPDAADALARLRTPLPVDAPDDAIMAMAAAVDLDSAIALGRQIAQSVQDQPFACPWLVGANAAADEALHSLAPLPPMARGIRGFAVALRDSDPDAIDGQLLLVGANVVQAVKQALASIPGIAQGPVETDGTPVAIDTQLLGVKGLEAGQIALRGDRVVGTAGADAQDRAARLVNAPATDDAPMFLLAMDLVRLAQRFPKLFEGADNEDLRDFSRVELRVDIVDGALRMDVAGTWK